LIPEDFGPHHLGSTGILDGQHVRWSLLNELPVPNSIEPELRDALERSYAPYSNEPSGAVIEMNDGTLYSGAYVENAAYDSYPALTVAVAKMVMSGHTDFAQISHLYVASGSLDPRAAKNIDHRSASKQIAASEALSVAPSKLVLISGLKVEKAQ
jgi:cytidine deaminase